MLAENLMCVCVSYVCVCVCVCAHRPFFVTVSVSSISRVYTQNDCGLLTGPPLSFFYPFRNTYMNNACNQLTVISNGQTTSTLSVTFYFSSNSQDIMFLVGSGLHD